MSDQRSAFSHQPSAISDQRLPFTTHQLPYQSLLRTGAIVGHTRQYTPLAALPAMPTKEASVFASIIKALKPVK